MTRTSSTLRILVRSVCISLFAAAMASSAGAFDVQETRDENTIAWTTDFEFEAAVLSIAGPAGVRGWQFPAGTSLSINVALLAAWADSVQVSFEGAYTYEISFTSRLTEEQRVARDRSRISNETGGTFVNPPPELPRTGGTFRVASGVIAGADPRETERTIAKDVLHYDDVIITGSQCVGFDCANGESFGYCTTKLKENNLQFCFEDTSTGAFPSNDWKIQINDTTSGGANYFTIWDTDSGRRPFTIEGGAPSHALYVEDYGRIGLGTSVPYVELHIVDGDTPTVRLDQDGSAGWTAQRWDVAGNESNFFVRDITHGGRLVFRIEPGAPADTLHLSSNGSVGIGTGSPDANLEIETTGSTAAILLDRSDGGTWYLATSSDNTFTMATTTGDGEELLILDTMGNLTTSGTVNGVSDRAAKTGFKAVDPRALLDAIDTLTITEWSLLGDPHGVRHVGPTAQDFHALFGLGADDRHIALSDMSGVALAAIQALAGRLEEREAEIDELNRRLADLEQRIVSLD